MSATPIPRTLQFSLMGARDMSIMRTPPPNRYPIQTEIATFSAEVIADAINFEMSRNGQVFFVNDRIANLPELASLIKKKCARLSCSNRTWADETRRVGRNYYWFYEPRLRCVAFNNHCRKRYRYIKRQHHHNKRCT